MQGKSKTTNEAGTDRDNKKVRYLILSGGLLPILLAGIISHVTANAMGGLSESRIRESQGQLETIVSKCTDTLQDLALGTEARGVYHSNWFDGTVTAGPTHGFGMRQLQTKIPSRCQSGIFYFAVPG